MNPISGVQELFAGESLKFRVDNDCGILCSFLVFVNKL